METNTNLRKLYKTNLTKISQFEEILKFVGFYRFYHKKMADLIYILECKVTPTNTVTANEMKQSTKLKKMDCFVVPPRNDTQITFSLIWNSYITIVYLNKLNLLDIFCHTFQISKIDAYILKLLIYPNTIFHIYLLQYHSKMSAQVALKFLTHKR